MKIKKLISLVLCLVLSFSFLSSSAFASGEDDFAVPFIIDSFEKSTGAFINQLFVLFGKFFGTDEENIPAPEKFTPSYEEFSGEIPVKNPEISLNAECWLMNEITLISEKTYSDPFNEADVDMLLYGNGRLYKIPGFWDGGNVWKIRFVCPTAGDWYFVTECTDEGNTSLHGKTGKITCSEYLGELDIYKHGFVTVKEGKKYFTYDDGTPFFYLGDTHWSLGDETIDMVKIISEKRASQGFTVWQSEPIGAKFDFTNGITEDDIAGLHDYDEKFKIIADNGLTHANAQFFFTFFMEPLIANFGGYKADGSLSDTAEKYLEKISRYWVARYSAFPVIWTLGQEADNDFYWNETTHPDWNYENNPYKRVAGYISKYDAFDHPLSAHQENAGSTAAYGNGEGTGEKLKKYTDVAPSAFRDVKAHNFYAAQWSPSKTERSDYETEKDYWFNSQGKPSVNYEGQYCYLWTKNFGARMQGWVSYLSGMYGYGWGGHDTWSYLNIFDEENDSFDGVDTITSEEKINATWEDALEYESTYQMGYMRKFFEENHWYELIPRFDNKAYFVPATNVYSYYASNSDNTEIVIYFYSFTDENIAEKNNTSRYGGIKTGTVGSLVPGGKYTYQWLNPVTGEYSEAHEFTASRLGTYYLGARPDDTDMVLKISLTA